MKDIEKGANYAVGGCLAIFSIIFIVLGGGFLLIIMLALLSGGGQ